MSLLDRGLTSGGSALLVREIVPAVERLVNNAQIVSSSTTLIETTGIVTPIELESKIELIGVTAIVTELLPLGVTITPFLLTAIITELETRSLMPLPDTAPAGDSFDFEVQVAFTEPVLDPYIVYYGERGQTPAHEQVFVVDNVSGNITLKDTTVSGNLYIYTWLVEVPYTATQSIAPEEDQSVEVDTYLRVFWNATKRKTIEQQTLLLTRTQPRQRIS